MTASEVRSSVWELVVGSKDLAGSVTNQFSSQGTTTRLVRCSQFRDQPGVLSEFAAAFQFPWYFGQNWHAFDECFGELEWLDLRSGLAVVFMDGELVTGSDPDVLRDLVTSLGYAAESWAETDANAEGRFIVQMSPERLAEGCEAWASAGVHFTNFVPS